jgi:hypothetical protein
LFLREKSGQPQRGAKAISENARRLALCRIQDDPQPRPTILIQEKQKVLILLTGCLENLDDYVDIVTLND